MDLDHSVILLLIRLIFAGVLLVIASILWRFMRRVRYVTRPNRTEVAQPSPEEKLEEFIIIRLDALPGREFDPSKAYRRLQELGLTFNDGAFDYVDEQLDQVLFSVLNKKKPNILPEEPSVLRNFDGLMFVMRLPIGDGSHQGKYFATLLAIVDELRKHLKANICNEHGSKLRNENLYAYQQRIETFEKRYGEHLAQAYHES